MHHTELWLTQQILQRMRKAAENPNPQSTYMLSPAPMGVEVPAVAGRGTFGDIYRSSQSPLAHVPDWREPQDERRTPQPSEEQRRRLLGRIQKGKIETQGNITMNTTQRPTTQPTFGNAGQPGHLKLPTSPSQTA
jgi:hypothetical protein